jgi:ABC-type multidrug transport system ATPase subunit/pSer/pThr/pTyr-binding forkhead associated (FHA) protein
MTTPPPRPDPAAFGDGPPASRIVLVGRAPGNDIVLRAPGVSARHARIVVEPGRLVLEDLGSRNGTFVGSPPRRIERAEIGLDDPLTFGDTLLPATALRDVLARTRRRDDGAGTIRLDDDALVTFGRGARASVAIDRPLVSALHASLAVERGRVIVRDLGSMTGTFVDGRRIDRPVEIGPGTLVQIDDRRYRLGSDVRTLEPVDTRADSIEAVDVALSVPGHPDRRLLEDVSLVIEPGELVAVMGPSGAGKSTLLSLVNGQAVPAAGRVLVGGLDLHDHVELFRGRIGFVPQDDILHADLTVWQALWYAARLRLPTDTTDADITARIRAVISQLGLEGTEGTRVGDQRKRGVSGGQRKRVNLALELLTDPPILVLDEPTSGLSSTDALSVIELLRSLADAGKTIIVTIHQPGLDAFRLFDAVAVIARDASTRQVGRLAFFGRAWPDAVHFFEPPATGAPPPTSVDGLLRGLATRPVGEWVRRWEASAARSIWVDGRTSGATAAAGSRRRLAPRPVARFMQWRTLVARTLALKAADRWNTAVVLLQAPVVALLIAAVFAKVLRAPPTLETWPRTGLDLATTMFVTALAAIWFGCSGTAREIVQEWPVYRRERMVGLSIVSYLAAKVTALVAIVVVQTGCLLGIVGLACGFQGPWWHAWLVLGAAALVGGAIGLVISATLRTTEAAAGVLPILLLPMIVLGGILVPLHDLPGGTRFLAAAMPSRWAFEGLVVPEARARPRVRHGAAIDPPAAVDPGPTGSPAEPPQSHTTGRDVPGHGSAAPGPFRLVAGPQRRFILPGRQRIADALEQAAGQAEAELRRAEAAAEQKAADMKRQMEGDVERRAAEMRRTIEADAERKAAEMQRAMEADAEQKLQALRRTLEADAQRKTAEMRRVMEEQMQRTVDASQADFEKRSAEMRRTLEADAERKTADMRRAMEEEVQRKIESSQADFEKRSAAMNAEVEQRIEGRIREANAEIEARLREMQAGIEAERARMSATMERLAGATPTEVVPPHQPERAADLDMAERFFARQTWRSPTGLPLAVLGGMGAAGVALAGLALRRRDVVGR